jgi:signal transduction histidine kinase
MEKSGNNLSENVKDYLERIIASTANMQKLIDDLLSFSRTASAEKKLIPFDLNSLLDEVKKSMKYTLEEQNVTIISDHLPVLKIIPFQFQQLLENIIGNAVKYSRTDVNPVITITSEVVTGKDYTAEGADYKKNYNKLSVTDNGIGFEQEYAKKIFEIFQRLHGKNEYSGTGIGLAICKKIVENHEGFITAQSRKGEGAVFNIFIPL